jgi:predicted nucleic acid-binding protein
MSGCPFLDTNVLLRHLLQDYPEQASESTELFDKIAGGDRCVELSATVIFEAVYILSGQFGIERGAIATALQNIIELDSIVLRDKSAVVNALEIYPRHRSLSFADCFHAALALEDCHGEIYTFDKEFRRVPGITRLEPGE